MRSSHYKILFYLFLILFIGVGVNQVYTVGLSYDDAFMSSIAKNIASGVGYASSYHEIVPYETYTSTGPTLQLPAAVAIGLFGNEYWVPGFATFFVCLMILLLLLKDVASLETTSRWKTLFWIMTCVFLFTTESKGSGEGGFLRLMTSLLGEGATLLLIAYSCSRLIKSHGITGATLAGVIAGLAILSKMVAVFAIGGILIGAYLIIQNQNKFRILFGYVGGTLLPSLLFETWKIASLGFSTYLSVKFQEFKFIARSGSGIKEVIKTDCRVCQLGENFLSNCVTFLKHYGGLVQGVLFVFVILIAAYNSREWLRSLKSNSRRDSSLFPKSTESFAFLLGWASLVTLAWWLPFSALGWTRHALVALTWIVLWSVVFLETGFHLKSGLGRLLTLVPLILVLSQMGRRNWPEALSFKKSERLVHQLEMLTCLKEVKSTGAVQLYGCGWWANRDFEYLLPGQINFKDCTRDPLFRKTNIKSALVRSNFWKWEHAPELDAVANACNLNLKEFGLFQYSECPP